MARWQLGSRLRRLREAAGIAPAVAAGAIEVSQATLSKIENGRQQIRQLYVRAFASLYGVDDATTTELIDLAKDANQPEWFVQLASQVPKWFRQYLGYESCAREIRTYTVELVDGLMQTEGYARGVALAGQPDASARDLEGYVAVRRGRQECLLGDSPPRLHTILNEAALRCGFPPEVRRAQLEHLVELADLDHVTLQVLEASAGPHPGMTSGFTLLGFDIEEMATVYLENGRGALYLDAATDLAIYGWKFDRLVDLALSPEDTRSLLVTLASDL
jgi:transcriptional regulator with XRE-family HTH domain